jgi:hypothetical protein
MASTTYLQQAYLAYFGRPADVSGLSFYADKTEAQVVAAFSASAESQAFFGSLNTLAQINTIYQNLFNRAAEPAGLTYWAGEINSGRLSLAQASMGILAGAQNADKLAVTNKLAAATAFTAALDTSAEMIGYQGSSVIASARAYLASVDSTAASLTAATATSALSATVSTVVAAGVSGASSTSGSTFTLTTGVDVFAGTAGNDTFTGFSGTGATISLADSVSGGGGTDTLRVFSDSATTLLPTITGITNLLINDTIHESRNIGTGTLSSVASLTLQGGTSIDGGTVTVTLDSGDSLSLDGVTDGDAGAATLNDGGIAIAQAATLTSTALSIKDVGAATANTAVTIDLAGTGVATLDLTVAGANHVTFLNTGAAQTTLNVSGAGSMTMYGELATTVTTINAANTTAAQSMILTGTSVRTVTGGTGDDIFVLGAGYIGGAATTSSRDIINGGNGTDTLSVTKAIAQAIAVAQANLTSIETLAISDAVDGSLNATFFTGVNRVVLEAARSANAATITVNSGTTVQMKVDADNEDTVFTVTGTGTSDTMTLILDSGIDFTGTTGTAETFTGIETLNIQTQSTIAGTVNIFADATTMTATASTETMNISGKTAITFTGVVTADVINGAGLVGSAAILTLTAGTASAAVITGGEAADVIRGSTSADIISGGGGADTITSTGGTDTMTLGAGADIFLLNGDHQGNVITDFTAGTGGDIFRFDDSSITASTNAGGINAAFIGTNALAFKAISAGITASAATDNVLVVQTAVAGTSVAAVEDAVNLAGGGVANFGATAVAYVIFNSTSGKAEVYLDAAGATDNAGTGVTLMATLDNITTLVGVQALVAANFDVQA